MIDSAIEGYFGRTVAEWLDTLPNELPVDAVGLWQIIPMGRRGFGLEGDDLIEFARRGILALLRKGAKPVRGDGQPWRVLHHYGETPEEIAAAVIAEWLASGGGDPDVSDVWFATPNIYEQDFGRPKIDPTAEIKDKPG